MFGVILSAPVQKICCDTGEFVCTHRSGIRLHPSKAQIVKRLACLICDQVEAAFLMRVLLLHRLVLLFCFLFFLRD